MLGKIIIYILFIMATTTTGIYFYSEYKKDESFKLARKFYYALILGVVLISGYFLYNIFIHNYQFTYIWDYSSNELPPFLLFSSFYAGNQGSFLLWTLLFSLVGFFLIPYTKKHEGYEPLSMGFYCLILSFLLMILMIKSPFEYVWETFKNDGIAQGFTPTSGKGMNPILQNYWITIHPPILFAGYVMCSIPFVFAITGLIKRDYSKWNQISYPWVLIGSGILGLGIMLGGFWAYETLGWGGFWGWDPVENSSLIPWLSLVALAHTMMINRKTNGLVKTNFFLSIITFLLVLYATFLTRSGVLGATSVHSFTDPGNTVYSLLVIMQITFALIGIVVFIMRFTDIKVSKLNFNYSSREFLLTMGALTLLFSAVIVFIGTSWPLLLEATGQTKAAVDVSFYNNWNLPLAMLIMLTNAISLFLSWKKSNFSNITKRLSIIFAVSIIATVLMMISGVNQLKFIALGLIAVFSLIVNFDFLIKNLKNAPLKLGGNLAHIGIALLLLGVIATSGYTQLRTYNLKKGISQKGFGYDIELVDKIEIEKEFSDRQKFIYKLKMSKGNNSFYVNPIVYWSDFNQRQSPFIEPGISRGLNHDIYAVLKSVDIQNTVETIEIIRDSVVNLLIDSNNTICLERFDMSHAHKTDSSSQFMGAFVKYNINGQEIHDTLTTKMTSSSVYTDYIWKKVPNSNVDIAFTRLIPVKSNAAKSIAVFAFKKSGEKMLEPSETLTVDISYKPFINLVWLGSLAISIGFFIAIFRKSKIISTAK